jgi:predicted PurR-regulated permease PerM
MNTSPSPSAPAPEPPFNWRTLHAVIVVLVLGAFLFSVRNVLNPFLLFLLLVFILAPLRGQRIYTLLLSAAGVLTLIWLLSTTGFLLAPFVLALVLAYIGHPLVTRMEARRIPRTWGATLLFLPAVVGMALLMFVGLPALTAEITDFIRKSPALVQQATLQLERLQNTLATRNFPILDEQGLLERLRSVRPEQMVAYLQGQQQALARGVWGAVLGVGRGLGAILSLLGYVFLTPILVFYLLRDWPQLQEKVAELVPAPQKDAVLGFAREYDRLLSSYLRGQVLAAAIVGVLTWLLLALLGFPHALLLGVIAGVFNLVPYLGLVVTAVPGVVLALFEPDPGIALAKLALVFVFVQIMDGAVVGPKIVGESVGLHPVTVILALSVFGFFFGFVGMLIAVPLAVLVKMIGNMALERYRASRLFRGDTRVTPVSSEHLAL